MLRDPALIPLSHQHHNGLALCVLTRRSLSADSSAENVAALSRRAVDRYELELTNHFEVEEKTLFPAVENQLGKLSIIAELVAEHRAIAAMVGDLRVQPSTATLEEFCEVLSGHIRREENELFPAIQERFPSELLDTVGRAINARVVRICL